MERLFIFLILSMGYPSFQSNVEAKKAVGFSIDLIHHDSKLSPFYNESATLHDLSTKVALHSIARANRFSSSPNLHFENKNSIQSSVIPNGGSYLMKLSFGTPPLETYAIASTGANFVWIHCGCGEGCYPQESRTFKSASSSTYRLLSCDTKYCQQLEAGQSACGVNNECRYSSYMYGDRSQTNGVLGSDTITFDSSNPQSVSFSGFVFGCGDNNNGSLFSSRGGGIVGLGPGSLSLISQLGDQIEKKFSYCLLPRTSNSATQLKFGSDSVLSGTGVVSTPFSTGSEGTFYTLTLEGITIGNKRLHNSEEAGSSNGRNIIIDTGTTLTMLESGFYQEVEDAVRGEIPLNPVQLGGTNYRLCYDRSSFGGVSGISMVFHFTGADVTLKQLNIFKDVADSHVCLAILPSTFRVSIFGNLAQVNFQVEYDLGKKQISFAPVDCARTQFYELQCF